MLMMLRDAGRGRERESMQAAAGEKRSGGDACTVKNRGKHVTRHTGGLSTVNPCESRNCKGGGEGGRGGGQPQVHA